MHIFITILRLGGSKPYGEGSFKNSGGSWPQGGSEKIQGEDATLTGAINSGRKMQGTRKLEKLKRLRDARD